MDRFETSHLAVALPGYNPVEERVMEDKAELDIGPKVALLASKLRVKQTEIAEGCGISRISVNRFFRGRSEIRASDLVKVLETLGIDLNFEIDRRLTKSF
jgi:hypothetical protein